MRYTQLIGKKEDADESWAYLCLHEYEKSWSGYWRVEIKWIRWGIGHAVFYQRYSGSLHLLGI